MKPNFLDYIYYRATEVLMDFNGEKEEDGVSASSVIFLSMIEGFLLGGLIVFVSRIFFDRTETAPYSKALSYLGVGILLAIIIINYVRYNGRLYELKHYWKNESHYKKKFKGILILLIFLLSWLPLILIGLYW